MRTWRSPSSFGTFVCALMVTFALFLRSVAFLCTILLASSFIDVLDFQQDNQIMHRGANLMYLALGSEEHNVKVAQSIISSFNVQSWGCYDVQKHSLISEHVHSSHPTAHAKLVVVHGLECLSSSERRALDFAYRLTDSSSDTSNVIVLFSLKASTSKGKDTAITNSGHDLKQKIAEALNEDSVFFNGHAFTGRLTRTFFESGDVEIALPAPGCAALRKEDMCTVLTRTVSDHRHGSAVDVPSAANSHNQYYVYIGIVVAVLVLLVVLFGKSSTSRGDEQEHVHTQRTVSATVHSSNPHTYTDIYAASATTSTYNTYSYADTTTSNTTSNAASNTTYSTPYDSPKRREGVARRSLTRLQVKQLAKARSSPTTVNTNNITDAPTDTHTNTYDTASHTAASHTTNSTKDRRSTGSISTQARHKPTSSGPAGEETIIWAGPDSNVHDTRSKKHTRSSARF